MSAPEIAVEGAIQIFSRLQRHTKEFSHERHFFRANKNAVGAKTKDNSVRDTLAHLMLRNLSEVFGERDSERQGRDQEPLFRGRSLLRSENQSGADNQRRRCSASGLFSRRVRILGGGSPCPQSRRRAIVLAIGPAGCPPVVNGMDVAQFKDGRIRSLYVFLNDEDH